MYHKILINYKTDCLNIRKQNPPKVLIKKMIRVFLFLIVLNFEKISEDVFSIFKNSYLKIIFDIIKGIILKV